MPVITALEQQKHNPERVNVYLDGSFGFGVSRLLIVARGLIRGKELTASEIEGLRHDDDVEQAYGRALNLLSYRPRSRAEIEMYFRRKKSDLMVVAAVIERLARIGLVDDAEFARFWVTNRQTFRPRGNRALRAELRAKGLDADAIAGAIDTLPDEEIAAYSVAQKKARTLRTLDERELVTKLIAFLQRRGFAYEAASAAARRVATEAGMTGDGADELPVPDPD